MHQPKTSKKFRKDVERLQGKKKKLEKLKTVMLALASDQKLKPNQKDHPLKGKWRYYRDCHVEPDLVLIYKINKSESTILFERVGSHSELF